MLQLYVLFYLLKLPPEVAGVAGLAINYSAYEAEIYSEGLHRRSRPARCVGKKSAAAEELPSLTYGNQIDPIGSDEVTGIKVGDAAIETGVPGVDDVAQIAPIGPPVNWLNSVPRSVSDPMSMDLENV